MYLIDGIDLSIFEPSAFEALHAGESGNCGTVKLSVTLFICQCVCVCVGLLLGENQLCTYSTCDYKCQPLLYQLGFHNVFIPYTICIYGVPTMFVFMVRVCTFLLIFHVEMYN